MSHASCYKAALTPSSTATERLSITPERAPILAASEVLLRLTELAEHKAGNGRGDEVMTGSA